MNHFLPLKYENEFTFVVGFVGKALAYYFMGFIATVILSSFERIFVPVSIVQVPIVSSKIEQTFLLQMGNICVIFLGNNFFLIFRSLKV